MTDKKNEYNQNTSKNNIIINNKDNKINKIKEINKIKYYEKKKK